MKTLIVAVMLLLAGVLVPTAFAGTPDAGAVRAAALDAGVSLQRCPTGECACTATVGVSRCVCFYLELPRCPPSVTEVSVIEWRKQP